MQLKHCPLRLYDIAGVLTQHSRLSMSADPVSLNPILSPMQPNTEKQPPSVVGSTDQIQSYDIMTKHKLHTVVWLFSFMHDVS